MFLYSENSREFWEKNNKFASIEEGTIDADTEIIVDTTKALEEGAVVRYGNRKE